MKNKRMLTEDTGKFVVISLFLLLLILAAVHFIALPIETVVMIGVVWNAGLQTYWLFWSKSVEKRKHFTDEEK